MRWWEIPVTKSEELSGIEYDVGIVLGGGMVTYNNVTDRRTYRNNVDRILQAVELYKAGRIKNILISGGAGNLVFRDFSEADLLREFLLEIGIKPEHIFVDTISDNTYQNAVYSKEILDEYFPEQEYLLITSAIHMKRSLACFRKQGLQVTPFCTNQYAGPRRFNFEFLIIPSAVNFILWDKLIHEVLGYVVYDIVGYI